MPGSVPVLRGLPAWACWRISGPDQRPACFRVPAQACNGIAGMDRCQVDCPTTGTERPLWRLLARSTAVGSSSLRASDRRKGSMLFGSLLAPLGQPYLEADNSTSGHFLRDFRQIEKSNTGPARRLAAPPASWAHIYLTHCQHFQKTFFRREQRELVEIEFIEMSKGLRTFRYGNGRLP